MKWLIDSMAFVAMALVAMILCLIVGVVAIVFAVPMGILAAKEWMRRRGNPVAATTLPERPQSTPAPPPRE